MLCACVRSSLSSGKLKTFGFAPYRLNFQKITYVFTYVILQYLAMVALKTLHKINTSLIKCLKHSIQWEVEIVNSNTSQLNHM